MGTNLVARCAGLLFVAVVSSCSAAVADVTPRDLKCEYRRNPLGIEASRPRLSWALVSEQRAQRQSAYQVLVASSPELLASDQGDLWDSGKVASSESIGVVYAGKPLSARARAYWKVRVWDQDQAASAFSDPAWWEAALVAPAGWRAAWIRRDKPWPKQTKDYYQDDPAPLLRKSFTLAKPIQKARAYVSGLGYYELSLNGQRIGDQVLDPGWTSYSKRVLYSTYDVTGALKQGENAVGMMLGNGWYWPLPMTMWGSLNLRNSLTVGRPRAILQIEIDYTDGSHETIASDTTWKTADGPIRRNNVYLGEVYDARSEQPGWDQPGFDDRAWQPAVIAGEPLGPLEAQSAPPIKILRTIKPVKLTKVRGGRYVFDFGQNFGGWVRLRVRGSAGTAVTITAGELLFGDGTLNARTSAAGQIKSGGAGGGPGAPANAFQQETYILSGKGDEVFTPRFTVHGFRYVQLSGYPGQPTLDSVDGLQLGASVEPAGTFSCSNATLNRIQEAVRQTLLSNLFSVESDCPHREKFGYGGDIVAVAEAAMMNFDMAAFYAKTVRDFEDAVRPNGGFTETSPFVGIADQGLGSGSGPVEWGTAHPLLQQLLYQYYGDRRLIEEQYEATQAWISLLQSAAPGSILNNGIGDHESIAGKTIAVSGTAFFYYNVELASVLADVLGRTEDKTRYAALAEQIRTAFNTRFLNAKNGCYYGATQANQSFALALGLVPLASQGAALDWLVADVKKHHGHLTTGIFGTRFLLAALSDLGRGDVAYGIVNQKGYPGWGYMLDRGATTLWEHWAYSDNTYSHNHPMFGSVSAWFFRSLAGIRPEPDAVAFNKIVIRPGVVGDLTSVAGQYNSVRGPVTSNWRKDGNQLTLDVTIPVGVTATVRVPAKTADAVREGGQPAANAPGVEYRGTENGEAVFRVGSGQYQFTVTN